MRRIIVGLGLSAVAGLFVLAAVGRAEEAKKEGKLSPENVPQKVMDSVKARFPGATVTSAEKEPEAGNVVYDLELKHDGRKYEMDIKEDGTVMEIEKEVAAKDVPAAVTKAVEVKYPKATVKEVMEVNLVKGKEEKPDHYEVVLKTDGGKELEVVVALDGTSVKEEPAEPKPAEKK